MILVTGGAGFIGSNLVDQLLLSNRKVRVVDNMSNGRAENLKNAFKSVNFELFVGDIGDVDVLNSVMNGVSAVVHLAAQVSVQTSLQNPLFSANENIINFLRILEYCRKFKIDKIVYASSAAVYGVPNELPLNEGVTPNPISPYGLEKYVNENYAKLYSDLYGLNCVGLRFFNVYGPRQDPNSSYAGVISKFLSNVNNGLPLKINGHGTQTRDFVHVFDISKVCEIALTSSYAGVVCVGTGKSVTINKLAETVCSVVGRHVEIIHSAPSIGDILFSEMSPEICQRNYKFLPEITLEEGLKNLWIYMNDCQ